MPLSCLRENMNQFLSENCDSLKRMVELKPRMRDAELVSVNRQANALLFWFFCLHIQGISGFLELVYLHWLLFWGPFYTLFNNAIKRHLKGSFPGTGRGRRLLLSLSVKTKAHSYSAAVLNHSIPPAKLKSYQL